jgi:hypothetical protein
MCYGTIGKSIVAVAVVDPVAPLTTARTLYALVAVVGVHTNRLFEPQPVWATHLVPSWTRHRY